MRIGANHWWDALNVIGLTLYIGLMLKVIWVTLRGLK